MISIDWMITYKPTLRTWSRTTAELWDAQKYPKIIIVGINKVGSELINLVHDVAKRCGIHQVLPADLKTTTELIRKGEDGLNIRIANKAEIFAESRGDYWLTQLFCHTACLKNDVLETKIKWRIAGEQVAGCNCSWGCPCQFNALPTTGHCEATWSVADQGRVFW